VRHLDFDASRKEHTGEPVTFTLAGRKLTTVPRLPFAALVDLYSDVGSGYDRLVAFLEGLVVDEDLPALREALRDKTHALTATDVDDAVSALLEEFTGRPTSPPPDSSTMSSDGGSPSKASSSPPASTSTS
jgi:hypothetical protein